MTRLRALVAVLALAAAPLGAGCDDEPLYASCPLSNSIRAACESEQATTDYTCVVASHPYCTESICASWVGSETFCTEPCTTAADCPTGSTCEAYLDLTFCVPAEAQKGGTLNP